MENTSLRLLLAVFCLTVCWCSPACNWAGQWDTRHNRCQCYAGFTGTNCTTDCHCVGHGVCKPDNTCLCEAGWKWSTSSNRCVWNCSCSSGIDCIGPGECGCAHTCKWGACRNGQCVCYEGYKGEDCSQYDRNIMLNKDVAVGLNLDGITYYSPEVKWVDVAKQSKSPWVTQRDGVPAWDTHEINKVPLRKDGYPISLEEGLHLGKLVYRAFGSKMMNGNFTILYDGEGTVGFGLASNKIHYQTKGRMVVEFPQLKDGGIEIKLMETNPSNPLHNLRLIPPGYENTYLRSPFHPLFLEKLKRFSELRFMDYLRTNGHGPEPTLWDNRTTVDFHSQGGDGGAAIEYLVQLANTVGAHPWVNMPHAADDNYVKQFATLVKQLLRPDLKVYLEYSNEVWNGEFRQTKYTQEKGQALWPNDTVQDAGMKYFIQRATQVADIWSQVWSGKDRDRVVRVIAWQTKNEWFYNRMLQQLGDGKSHFDALAITGYFDCGRLEVKEPDEFANMTMSQIKHNCDLDLVNQKNTSQYYIDTATKLGLKLVMYEGGPGFREANPFRDDPAVTAKAIAFNRDPLMQPALEDILNAWYTIVTSNASNTSPGGLFNYFASTSAPSRYGMWGMTEYSGQDLSNVSKWLGVQTYISDRWPHSPLGPNCSFVEDQATKVAYGCFPATGGFYVCAKSEDSGNTWTNLPNLNQSSVDHVTLDGYDVTLKKLYVRVTDRTYVNTYHAYSDATRDWTAMPNFHYFAGLYSPAVLPRIPTGADQSLYQNLQC